jgi:hypothetical protein
LIVNATLSDQIVARTHRYKLMTFGSLILLGFGLLLMTNLRRHGPSRPLGLDGRRRLGHRPVVRGVHGDRPSDINRNPVPAPTRPQAQ